MGRYFDPIDFEPPDISKGVGLLMAARKANQDAKIARAQAETQRQYAENARQENEIRRQSAQREREKYEEEKKHRQEQDERERVGMLLPNSPLMRAVRQAHGNPDFANALGKPYGINFDQGFEGPDVNPASGGMAPPPAAAAAVPPTGEPPPDITAAAPGPEHYEGPDVQPGNGEFQSPVQPPPFVPPGSEPAQAAAVAAAAAPPPPSAAGPAPTPMSVARKLYANFGGQHFEVPQNDQGTGLGDKYQQVFERAVSIGLPEDKAFQLALTAKEKDDTQKAIADRTAASVGARIDESQRTHRGIDEQDARDRFLAEEAMKRTRVTANARVAAAAPEFKQEGANDRAMSLLERRAAGIRQTGQFNKLVANDKTVRSITANLASTEPLPHKDAQVAVARYFRQAQPTDTEMHMLYDQLGGWTDKFDQFKAKVINGDLSPEQLRQLQASAKIVAKEHGEDKRRFRDLARSQLGPGSGFENTPDQAQALYQGMADELGIEDAGNLYDTEGGITVGAKKPPTIKPRGTKKRKSPLDDLEAAVDRLTAGGK